MARRRRNFDGQYGEGDGWVDSGAYAPRYVHPSRLFSGTLAATEQVVDEAPSDVPEYLSRLRSILARMCVTVSVR